MNVKEGRQELNYYSENINKGKEHGQLNWKHTTLSRALVIPC